MAKDTVKLDGRDIPCKDVLKIQMRMVSDEIFYEVTYRKFEPMYHQVCTLLSKDKAHKLEQKVRKYCSK